MQSFIKFLRRDARVFVIDLEDTSAVIIPKGEFIIEVLIPSDALEWSVMAIDIAGNEVWQEVMSYQGAPDEPQQNLSGEMENDARAFIEQMISTRLRMTWGADSRLEWQREGAWREVTMFVA
ncbi:MAG: hypothetical protein ACK4UN_11680 [Limisphaerales bacterium]